MKKAFWISFFAAAVLGTLWHFLYDALPCALTALLAPVNESVWEHLKLLFFPPLLVSFFLRRSHLQRQFWSGVLAGILAMPLVLLGVYYTLTAGFGVPDCPAVDIPLYYAVLLLGWWLAARLCKSGRAASCLGPIVILAGVYWSALTVFTAAAPPLPIFTPK